MKSSPHYHMFQMDACSPINSWRQYSLMTSCNDIKSLSQRMTQSPTLPFNHLTGPIINDIRRNKSLSGSTCSMVLASRTPFLYLLQWKERAKNIGSESSSILCIIINTYTNFIIVHWYFYNKTSFWQLNCYECYRYCLLLS